jgi:pimeloyl-ACP methyl ester carboxylesterase
MDVQHTRRGAGEALLLVHGLGDRREAWDPVLDRLAEHHEVVALDLPGFGASPPLPDAATWSVDALADVVAGLAADLGFARWHVAGNSLGGGIALTLAARGAAASAVALSPIGFGTPRERRISRAILLATRAGARLMRPVAGAAVATAAGRTLGAWHMQARPWRMSPELAALRFEGLAASTGFDRALESTVWWEPPARVDVPLTIAWGDRDRLLFHRRQAPRARRRYPAARHVTLRGCGHLPTTDDPGAVADVILAGPAA